MPKRYSLNEYSEAVRKLADYHGEEVALLNKGGKAYLFKLFIKGNKSGVPLESWVVWTSGGNDPVIASGEALKLPAQYIRNASQEEFTALLEGLFLDQEELSQ